MTHGGSTEIFRGKREKRVSERRKSKAETFEVDLPQDLEHPNQILTHLFQSSTIGMCLLDRDLVFRAANESLGIMSGVPASEHKGKSMLEVVGPEGTRKTAPAVEKVLNTKRPLTSLQIQAKPAGRQHPSHWIADFFPVPDAEGEVKYVGALMVESPKRSDMEEALSKVTGKLMHVKAALTANFPVVGTNRAVVSEKRSLLTEAVELVEQCLRETRALQQALELTVLRPSSEDKPPREAEQEVGGEGRTEALTGREREVVRLLAEGQSNKEIGQQLEISVRTAETYRARIMMKLGMHSLAQLVLYAVKTGLVKV